MTLKNNFDMKPDKIYFGFCEATHLESYCLEKKGECQTEYIRKNALVEWLEPLYEEYRKRSEQGEMVRQIAFTYKEVIDKINSI